MNAESCRRRQPSFDVTLLHYDVTTRRYDDDDDDDVNHDYSGHLSVAKPTSAITHQSAAREPGRRGASPDDVNTSSSWSQANRKLTKAEMANSGEGVGRHVFWAMWIVLAQVTVSAHL